MNATRQYELRPYQYPGKFEGGLIIDEPVYEASLAGCDDEAGDVAECGEWYGLLRGPIRADGPFADIAVTGDALTSDERRYLGSIAGAIVSEDSQGFVRVEYHGTAAELEAAWGSIVRAMAEAEGVESDD